MPDSGSVTLNGFGFTGEQVDPETGFAYLRNRYYDPVTSRFLTPDPLGMAGSGVNLYAYVGNNPATLTDPSGLDGDEEVKQTLAELEAATSGYDIQHVPEYIPYTNPEAGLEAEAEAAGDKPPAGAGAFSPAGEGGAPCLATEGAEDSGGNDLPPIRGGSGEDEPPQDRPTGKGRIRAANLPTTGRIRYIPPDYVSPTADLPKANSPRGYGYVDKFGNVWVWNAAQQEWDVQLSRQGKAQLGWLSKTGDYVNVAPDGHVTH